MIFSYFTGKRSRLLGVLITLLLGLAGRSQAQVYYLTSDGSAGTVTATDALNRVNFDGTGATPLVSSIATIPNLLALDPAGSRAFVYEGLAASRGIKVYSNLGGTPVLDRTLPVPALVTAIEYDAASDYVYFLTSDNVAATLSATDALNRIKADGSGTNQVLVQSIASSPAYLALNTAGSRAYVYEGLAASRGIKTVDLSTNTVSSTTIAVTAAVAALDYASSNGYLYYLTTDAVAATTSATDAIYRVPATGGGSTPVITGFTSSPTFMALNLASDRIYVADNLSTARGFVVVQASSGTVTATYPQAAAFTAIEIGQSAAPTTVNFISRNAASPTNAGSVSYVVTFGASVTGVTAANFDVVTTGTISSAGITSVTGSGTTWTVTVSTGTGSGSLTLRLVNSTNLSPGLSTTLPFAGDVYVIDKTAPTVTITSATAPSGSSTSTAPFSYTVTFSEPVSGFVAGDLVVTNGTLASGPTAGSGNTYTFTVTPTTAGTVTTVSVGANSVQDAVGNGNTVSNTYALTFSPPTITLAPATLPTGPAGAAYSQTIIASGGTAPYTYAITAGALPAGLTLAANGTLAGTPTAGGSFAFTVRATDASASPGPYSGTQAYTLTITAPSISVSPAALLNGAVGTAYSQSITASGGTAPYTYAVTAGALPTGLTLTAGGVLAGTPTAGGSFTFTVTATDATTGAGPYSGGRSYSLVIAGPTIVVSPTTLPGGTVAVAYSTTFTASGGTAPYSFAVTSGALPAGLTLVMNGILSGTPTTSGTFNFTITATDASTGSGPYTGSRSFSLTIAPPAALVISPVTLPSGTVAAAYSQAITASGGTAPYTYAITAGALPAGMTLASNGTLAGTPTAGGSFSFTITATDTAPGTASTGARSYTLTIAAPTVVVAPATLPNGAVGTTYSQTITTSGGTAPYTYAITAGALPPGVSLTAGGVLAGMPTASGTFTFTVRATDASTGGGPYTGSRTYSLTIAAPTITVAPATLPGGTVGAAYSQNLTASGGLAPYTYTVTAGALPGGLALSAGGVLSGTPTAGGSFTFTITATDAAATPGPYSGSQTYTLTIAAPTVVVNPTTLPAGTVGTAYSQPVTASGGTAPYSFAVTSGTLPAGLTLVSNGTLAGTPTATGSFSFTITATDASTGSGPYTGSRSYTLSVTAPASITWTGVISPDWFTAANWSPNVVPSAGTSATIPASAVFQPTISAGTATTLNLTLNSGATLTMSNGTLDVRGNLTNNGSFTPSGGTVVLGTTASSNGPNILGSSRVRFWNLAVNANGVLLSTSAGASVRRLLTLNGAFVTQGNAFVLESDASGTAMVVNSSSAGFVFGAATVQRYIDASGNTGISGYRHYSSPVGGATVNNLSTSAYGGSFTAQVNAAYNTADPNLLTLAAYPNVFSYDESKIATSPAVSFSDFDKGYQSPASLNDPLTVGRGYAVQIGNAEKVQFTGPLNNNTQTITGLTYAAAGTAGSTSAGWALVGNPYPAPLDWRTVGNAAGSSLNGVDGAAYVFQSTSAYSGRYTSFTNNVGAGSGLIASGQGFFVRASTPGTTGSITLTNANRVTSYASPAFQRTTAETRPLLRLSLGLGNQPATVATAQDETFVYFETGATDGYDGKFDAYKLANPSGYYLGSITPGSAPLGLSIDGRAPLAAATTTELPLWVSLPAGTYSLTATELLNFASLAGGTTVQLRDALLGTITDLATVPSYSFSVAANAPYAGRFSLVFRTSGVLATLPGTGLAQAKASLYPNPATSATALSVTGLPTAVTGLQVEVLDVLGRTVVHYTLPVQSGRAQQSLATDQLAGTLYLLRLTALDAKGQAQGTLPTQRLTLTH